MKKILFVLLVFFISFPINSQDVDALFNELNNSNKWELQLADDCTGDWKTNWFLDGQIAKVENSGKGMHLQAGPEYGNDAHHMVLWTKQSFEGDVKIEFCYTRTDHEARAVNILYIQASGKEEDEFAKDISQWSHLRKTPSMSTYFNNMKTLHISYAAFSDNDETEDYLRVRRYPVTPEKGFEKLEVEPTFFNTGLFKSGETYKITVIKTDSLIYFKVEGKNTSKLFSWDTSHLPPVKEGRIGLRHMYTRSAIYKDFKVHEK